MVFGFEPRRVVRTISGPGTAAGGPGDILIDNYGTRWTVVLAHVTQGTADRHGHLQPDGTITER